MRTGKFFPKLSTIHRPFIPKTDHSITFENQSLSILFDGIIFIFIYLFFLCTHSFLSQSFTYPLIYINLGSLEGEWQHFDGSRSNLFRQDTRPCLFPYCPWFQCLQFYYRWRVCFATPCTAALFLLTPPPFLIFLLFFPDPESCPDVFLNPYFLFKSPWWLDSSIPIFGRPTWCPDVSIPVVIVDPSDSGRIILTLVVICDDIARSRCLPILPCHHNIWSRHSRIRSDGSDDHSHAMTHVVFNIKLS